VEAFITNIYFSILLFDEIIRARVVKEVVNFRSLASHRFDFEFHRNFWILSCEEVIQLAYGMLVVILRYPFLLEILFGKAPSYSPSVKLECRYMTRLLCWCDVKKTNSQSSDRSPTDLRPTNRRPTCRTTDRPTNKPTS
jgi:hypothetical protein